MSIDSENNYKVPEFLFEMLNNQYEKKDVNRIIDGLSKKRVVSLRINTLKSDTKTIKNKLTSNGIEFEEIFDIFQNGEIYMQSLSSMLPPIILNPKENTDILDMCAAPRW